MDRLLHFVLLQAYDSPIAMPLGDLAPSIFQLVERNSPLLLDAYVCVVGTEGARAALKIPRGITEHTPKHSADELQPVWQHQVL